MIELTWIPGALRAFAWLYVLLVLVAVGLALTKPKTTKGKALWTVGIVALLGVLPITLVNIAAKEDEAKKQVERQAYQVKLAAATAQFQKRCQTAGEKIAKTVANVEGIVWMKWRSAQINQYDQFKLDDPYGQDCSGEGCIEHLLRVTRGAELNPAEAKRHTEGYRYVETTDPNDGKRYRYTGVIKLRPIWTAEAIVREKKLTGKDLGPSDYIFTSERERIDQYAAHYGVTWEDISTTEDRDKWIAGSLLKVLDLKTNEVVAERIGYMIDKGQGSTAGGRQPWTFAAYNACPSFPTSPSGNPVKWNQTREFVEKSLKPAVH